MADLKAVEYPTLKVPYEILNKKFRIAQKTLDRELCQIQNVANELESSLELMSAGEITRLLGGVVERLQVLKRKADECISDELSAVQACKRRLDHVRESVVQKIPRELSIAFQNDWKQTRLDRMIVDHFLRLGYYDTAERLAIRRGIRDLTNLDVFQTTREVEEDLRQHNTGKYLAWCNDNKSKLRKINSNIEFQLRVQEFVELIRNDDRLGAVRHARRYFPAFEKDQLHEISQCMALLAFQTNTDVEPYKSLFDVARWDDLILNYRMENYRLFQLSNQSVLSVVVQAGLSALKTPQCYSTNNKNSKCPVCQPSLNRIAEKLPYAHCAQSRLICRVTGAPLNEHNIPVMLPNGQVFGQKALAHITKENGAVVCPKTKTCYVQPKIEKIYVM